MTYKPGMARIGEPTPQSHPEQFTNKEIKAEIKYLMRLNKRYGSHPLRTMAYLKLMRVLDARIQSSASPSPFMWRCSYCKQYVSDDVLPVDHQASRACRTAQSS
jgi:hypothetical protein